MPSPFPGMDPFIESQKWRGFHHSIISSIRDALMPSVRPRYVVDVEENVYLAKDDGDRLRMFAPDVSVVRDEGWMDSLDGGVGATVEPQMMTLPQMEQIEEAYLVLRARDSEEVVTVIEVLSPTNKSHRDGRAEYLSKRNALSHSEVNLVEIDLLRGGLRLPMQEPLPPADYYTFVLRAADRPKVSVYHWPLDHRLPVILIPLADGDADVPLDLQAVLDDTYDRSGYDYALKYGEAVEPPLSELRIQWVCQQLEAWQSEPSP